uniref:Serpentine Receptor, class H n=1 Tax=Caenorhabditis japonica TaxID=281687 RepID=A0A8R1HTN9_CAEJA
MLVTSELYSFALHCLGCISLPIYVFGTYCILLKTPSTMKSVQWTLFNFHIWSCSLDVGISLLTTPYVFFPALAGYPLGLLNDAGVAVAEQTFLIVAMVGIVYASALAIFESRLQVLMFANNYWHRVRTPFLVFNFAIGALFFLPNYLHVPEQNMAVEELSKSFEFIPNYEHIDLIFVLSVEPSLLLRTGVFALLPITFEIFAITLLTRRIIRQRSGMRMSKATARLQKKFHSALVAQLTTPVFIVFVPISYIAMCTEWRYHNQAINNFCLIILSVHGCISTIMMIAVHKPYREFTLRLLNIEVVYRPAKTRRHSRIHSMAVKSVLGV